MILYAKKLKIFTGNANPELALEIADYLGITLGNIKVGRFSDGEIKVNIEESVRGADIFLIQPTCYPSNENVMELLIMMDALRRASARRITAVIPYLRLRPAGPQAQARACRSPRSSSPT